jgi:hypothetical protein
MKNIILLSLTLIMFSLFSVSYVITSVSAQNGMAPDSGSGAPHATGTAPDSGSGAPHATGTAPDSDSGTPHATGTVPDSDSGTPHATGTAPTGVAPTSTPGSVGISGWIKGGLQALGIGPTSDEKH